MISFFIYIVNLNAKALSRISLHLIYAMELFKCSKTYLLFTGGLQENYLLI